MLEPANAPSVKRKLELRVDRILSLKLNRVRSCSGRHPPEVDISTNALWRSVVDRPRKYGIKAHDKASSLSPATAVDAGGITMVYEVHEYCNIPGEQMPISSILTRRDSMDPFVH